MTAFTRLGSSIWDWERWTHLDADARVLWLALYTSGEAKRHVPGLWQGGIPGMADAAHMNASDVVRALDKLLDHGLVEYDPRYRVLRLCELPDTGEYPSNGKVIRGWWTKFQTVPTCAVRDAHVHTLAWICHEGGKRSRNGFSPHHKEAWDDTFARIVVPSNGRNGIRRLAESDTSTAHQPSLFTMQSGSPASAGVGAISGAGASPQLSPPSVDNSAVLRQLNKISGPETVSDTVSDTDRIPDPGSRIPDPGSSSSSGEGDRGRGQVLTLVPPDGPYTAGQALRELAGGPWDPELDGAYQDALGAMIGPWARLGVGLPELRAVAEYNAHVNRVWNARLLVGCDIQFEIATARRTLDWRDVRMANMLHP